jgi:hypothetical protein
MQLLRRQCDVERAGLAGEELGVDADALGRRLLAAAQAAAAVHMAEQTRRSLLAPSSTTKALWKATAGGSSRDGGAQ